MKDIPMYNTFVKVIPIKKGMSGDKKYYIETNNDQHLLLRVADISKYDIKKREYELMNKLYAKGVPMPKTIDFGICNEGKNVYTIIQWIDGKEVEKILPLVGENEQYLLGIKSGKILKLIHSVDAKRDTEEWNTRYFAVIDERMDFFFKEGVKFSGNEKIVSFLKANRGLLEKRPQCCHHGDYHMGNMIESKDNKLFIIDWHTVDFDNYGDPWYEFNRIGVEYPAFASGEINGYFDDNPPNDFWILLAYYLSASAITSIVWAKYFAPDELDSIIKLNKNILQWYDGMKSMIPSWYKRYN